MTPLATLFIEGLPYVPKALQDIALLTVCVSDKVFDNLAADDLSPWFCIRKYTSLDGLVPCRWDTDGIRPFPLTPKLVENDFPVWDGGGLPPETEAEIIRLEADGVLDYYDDIYEENYAVHKIGGYPSFCQSGFWFGDGYEYVLQVASDDKACLNIIDSGNFYFFYHPALDGWKVYCDFY